ncbi:dihydrodipicolinate synthase family protein [Methylobacterium sp. J-078]|uniref:dihydrodipicolinate synthase family protein n=1 Tax=Methylobacterium sp. J-078 TaxID=2836657 RepID=UPI001FB92EC7|nr:dihydrodipicolinate synthase family protein [Methylobacterium sp. J-078]MCJ2046909.1 dihydrodipicolinate synthase family protein [Methylobacterium sp. J-078]
MVDVSSEGVPVWAAIHTPFTKTGAVDDDGIRSNVRRYIELGLAGVFCNGLIGEVWALTVAERRHVLETILDEASGRLKVSVVVTATSIPETLEFGAHAKSVGADSAVLMVPTSGPRSSLQQVAYFEYVCPRLEMPVVLFNAATAAGSALDPAAFARISTLPNLTLLKTTASAAENNALRNVARRGVAVSDPLEENFLGNYRDFGQRVLFADPEPYLYQVGAARPIADYIAHLAGGRTEEAEAMAARLSDIRAVFNAWVMDPLRRGHMPGAAVKVWCDLIGMAGGSVRAPLTPLTESERGRLRADLDRCGLLTA